MMTLIPTKSLPMKVGDTVSITVKVRNPWWAVWRPRYRSEVKTLIVKSVLP